MLPEFRYLIFTIIPKGRQKNKVLFDEWKNWVQIMLVLQIREQDEKLSLSNLSRAKWLINSKIKTKP